MAEVVGKAHTIRQWLRLETLYHLEVLEYGDKYNGRRPTWVRLTSSTAINWHGPAKSERTARAAARRAIRVDRGTPAFGARVVRERIQREERVTFVDGL